MHDSGLIPAWGHGFTAPGSLRLSWKQKAVGFATAIFLFILFKAGEPETTSFLLAILQVCHTNNASVSP